MSDCSTPEQVLQQYLQPDYWDGHSIGVGETVASTMRVSSAATKAAKYVVNNFLSTGRTPFPLDTYAAGEALDADQWAPGSLLYGRQEQLHGHVKHLLPAPEDTDMSVPQKNTDLSYEPGASADFVAVGKVFYATAKGFFVVAPFEDGNRLMPVYMHDIRPAGPDGLRAFYAHPGLQKEFTVAETTHLKVLGGHELLFRMNTLQLVARGKLKKKASIAERLARLHVLPQTS